MKSARQQMTDWFGQPIQIEQPEPKPQSPNPCVQVYGAGPAGKCCGDCAQLAALMFSRTIYKCRLRKNTHSARTDHRKSWTACAKFEQRSGDIPISDGR